MMIIIALRILSKHNEVYAFWHSLKVTFPPHLVLLFFIAFARCLMGEGGVKGGNTVGYGTWLAGWLNDIKRGSSGLDSDPIKQLLQFIIIARHSHLTYNHP